MLNLLKIFTIFQTFTIYQTSTTLTSSLLVRAIGHPASVTMLLFIKTVLFAALPFSLAQSTCTTSNAVSWADRFIKPSGNLSGCSKTCGADANCLQQCNSDPCVGFENDPEALQACRAQEQLGDIGGGGGDIIGAKKRNLRLRDTLTCSSSETCYENNGFLFCLDPSTGKLSRNNHTNLGHGGIDIKA